VLMLLLMTALFAPVAWSDWQRRGVRPFNRVHVDIEHRA
jgi:hypothetical protein